MPGTAVIAGTPAAPAKAKAQRAELRLRLAGSGPHAACDVVAEFDATTTVAALAGALAEHAGDRGATTLSSPRLDVLDPTLAVAGSSLRHGDVVALVAEAPRLGATPREAPAAVELAFVGGLAGGRRVPLALGRHQLGRDRAADVVIDDPSLSRRHLTIEVEADNVTISDAGSSNGTAIDGHRLDAAEPRPVTEDDHVELGRSLVAVRPRQLPVEQHAGAAPGAVDFNRPPRMARSYEAPHIEVPAPPDPPRTPRLPLAASLVPVLMGVAMFAVLRAPTMLLFALLGPAMALSTFFSDRSGGRKQYTTDMATFQERMARLQDELRELRAAELRALRAAAPDAAELAARAEGHLPTLWERRRADPDFLTLRLGTADRPAEFSVALGHGGEQADRAGAQTAIAGGCRLAAAPLVTSVPDSVGVGLAGDPASVDALARWLALQAATLHSPRDVVIAAALSAEREGGWRALRWLPHLGAQGSPLDHDHFAVGPERAASLVHALGALAKQRRDANGDRFAGRAQRHTQLILILDEAVAPTRAIVEELLGHPEPLDIAVIWLGRDRRDIPGGCGTVVTLSGQSARMSVAWPNEGRQVEEALPDGVDVSVADAIARGLAPVRDAGSASAAADIPRAVSLLELLDLIELEPSAVRRRWLARNGAAIDAAIGHRGDRPLTLDLRADGPHALVAGTTGAGKSELLQTLVTSLALNHPPQRLSFLFVDYKGGAAFKDCVRLPHTVGMVTDLDPHLVRRALLSLNAELRRREEILHEYGVKDLVELERRRPEIAPASLVIVIDEFAALKSEVPEFVDGVVDIAQRGRSLGVHLVLATQRPAGIVSDNIRANTNLRIALRVSDPSESSDVVGDPVAARIARSLPGRGFVRTGHGELTEFQSAYVGGHSAVATGPQGTVTVRPLDGADGARPGAAMAERDLPTDLERAVEAIARAADEAGEALPPSPWLPPLPEILPLDELGARASAEGCAIVPLGVVDPARQRQYVLRLDLERDGHLLVYGTSGSGKTTLLRTIAVSLATRAAPRELHLYGLDCTGRGLLALEALPHCAAVILGDDEERVRRLFTQLRRAIDDRSRLFAERGVSTLAEYVGAAGSEAAPPRIVLLLDSYAGFTAAFDRVDLGAPVDALARIVSDGRAAGVHLIATADRRNAVPQAVASVIARKLVLRQADEDEYASLGLDRRATRGAQLPPGRGFAEGSLEIQTPLVGDNPSGEGVAAAIAATARARQHAHAGDRAPELLALPEHHPWSALPAATDPSRPYVGIDELDHAPVCVDLRDAHFLVTGPFRSGRTTALATIVASARQAPEAPELHLLAPRRSALLDRDWWESSARGEDACVAAARALLELVHERSADEHHPPLFVVVDDAGELSESVAATSLEALARRGRDVNVRIVAACENAAARGYNPWIGELRKDGNGLLLSPNLDLDGDLLGAHLPRRNPRTPVPGRGYLVSRGCVVLIQVARASPTVAEPR